jgi:endonuclease-3
MNKSARKLLLKNIYAALSSSYGVIQCPLNASNPYELMIATVLSSQCTDARVNKITPSVFKKYPGVKSMAKAKQEELEELIKSAGFFHAKASNIIKACRAIVENHNAEVPDNMEALTSLSGIGRKTANVILGNAFNKPGFPVDTHVIRLTNRIGVVETENPEKIEKDIIEAMPDKYWTDFSHLLITHGRRRCTARKPDCKNCEILSFCIYGSKNILGAGLYNTNSDREQNCRRGARARRLDCGAYSKRAGA